MIYQELEWTGERLVSSVSGVGVIEHLHRYSIACEFVSGKEVLDIASGEGYGSNLLAKNAKKVIGVDISEEVISFAKNKYKRSNLEFKSGSVTEIPLENNSVDIVVSFETLEHISDQDIMFNEIRRVMKTDGLLIISTPEKSNYEDKRNEKNNFHVKELYFKEFEKLINENFSNYCFLFQKTISGSLVVPQSTAINKFSEYSGDFHNVFSLNGTSKPIFNIGLASNKEIPLIDVSYFDAEKYFMPRINELERQLQTLLKSKTYRVGRFLVSPLIRLKRLFRK